MGSTTFFLVISLVMTFMDKLTCKPVIDEPVCTSRYDFESSLLKDMVKLDFDMTVLKQSYDDDITNLKTETKLAAEKLEKATQQLEESQAQAVSELTALGNAQKKTSDDKINELEEAKALLQDEINTRFSTLELQMETKLGEIKAAAIKRPVAFLVNTLPDTNVAKNKVLKFTKSVWNTNNDYDSTSGYFTAPINGTFIFSLQLCIQTNKYVHVQIVADDVVITNAILHESGSSAWSCSTASGVAILNRGGRVCAKIGNGYSTIGNTLYQHESDRWASFMGALVN